MIKFLACARPPKWMVLAWLKSRSKALRTNLALAYERRSDAQITLNAMTDYVYSTETRLRALNAKIAALESPARMLRDALSNRNTR